jgi:hypothetical protein
MSEQSAYIPIPSETAVRRNHCNISIGDDSIHLYFDQPIPDGPHKVTRMETMAAAALLGIARALTGQAEKDVVRAIAAMERGGKKR